MRPSWVVAMATLGTVALRLPWLTAPLSSDEGGFLLVAGQWHSGGSSLYGDYWVDRPPLLIAIFAVAHLLGGAFALRVLGCVAAATTVVLAARLGRLVGGGRVAWCAAAAAGFVSMPLFDAHQVSGELLAAPIVLGGVFTFLFAHAAHGRRRAWLMATAGACAVAAFLVKQSFVDGFVFVACFAATELLGGRRGVWRDLTAWGGGAVALFAAVGAGATALGTTPSGLWEAVVLFRADAARVIATSASSATADRLHRYPMVLVVSGALLVVLLAVARASRLGRPAPLTMGMLGLLSWEAFAVVGGGSYWLHYLMGLVPGLVLATALLVASHDRLGGVSKVVVSYAVVVALVSTLVQLVSPGAPPRSHLAAQWLKQHRLPGDTALVAYGQPNLLTESGTSSPYPDLWSLIVKVRDPRLRRLTAVLDSGRAPDWLLVQEDFASWGVDPSLAQAAVDRHYREVADVCGFDVFLLDGVQRSHDTASLPLSCLDEVSEASRTSRSARGIPADLLARGTTGDPSKAL